MKCAGGDEDSHAKLVAMKKHFLVSLDSIIK